MRQKAKMNAKKLLVSLVAITSVLVLMATVSAVAATPGITDSAKVEVNGMRVANDVAVIAGEKILVRVEFTATNDDTDVTIEAELEGEKVEVDAITAPFDIENGSRYAKILVLSVPYELKDDVSDELTLAIEIDGKEYNSELAEITLMVQRPSYNAEVKSITVSQTVEAGDKLPVTVVLKNRGYNDLDDLYVTARIVELGVEKTAYFGDLVAMEDCDSNCDDDDEDSTSGVINLNVPYSAEAGVYTVEVTVSNEDSETVAVKQIVVKNDFSNSVIVTSASKTIAAGEEAVYDLLVVNPTDKLKVYRVVTENSADVASSTESAVVAVPAGSSKIVKVSAVANAEGSYAFDVSVFSGDELVSTVPLSMNVEGKSVASNPVVVLTVILGIVFLVLLVVLIVLLGKKPSQTEEFGESYY